MALYCDVCGRDLNVIWQDNMSQEIGGCLCEDCAKKIRPKRVLLCDVCGRDLNTIWQDNMSREIGGCLCEDCAKNLK